MPISVNGQPVQDENIQTALEMLSANEQFEPIFTDENIGTVDEANALLDVNRDGVVGREDLEQLRELRINLTDLQFCATARFFAERFPRTESSNGFVNLSDFCLNTHVCAGTPVEARRLIDDFLQSPRTPSFRPEFSARHFFSLFLPAESSNLRRVTEYTQIIYNILHGSNDTRFTVFVSSNADPEPIRELFLQSSPDLLSYYEAGRLEFRAGNHTQSIWAQDLGESVLQSESGSEFIIGFNDTAITEVNLPHIQPYNPSEIDIPVTQIPILFEGGDLTTTTINNERVVVIGPRTIRLTKEYYLQHFNYDIPDDEIGRILQHTFAADRILILRNSRSNCEPRFAFHIDQAVFFLKMVLQLCQFLKQSCSIPQIQM